MVIIVVLEIVEVLSFILMVFVYLMFVCSVMLLLSGLNLIGVVMSFGFGVLVFEVFGVSSSWLMSRLVMRFVVVMSVMI